MVTICTCLTLIKNDLINLSVLLAGTCSTIGTTSLPSNNNAINVLKPSNSPKPETGDKEDSVKLNKYYVTLITEGNMDTWYLATCVGKNNNGTYYGHVTWIDINLGCLRLC